jgi:aminoglycoside 6'-N-acetyltransferase
MEDALVGRRVTLRPATPGDVPALAAIRRTPEVYARWRGSEDLEREIRDDLDDRESVVYAILHDGRVVGSVQWSAETEPDYRHASIDIYIDPSVHGRGLGTDAVRTLARHLVTTEGHHRITIDPAVDNEAAIRSYAKVGFRPVGVMRRYERDVDGTWHDNLLMDLLADELTEDS